MGQGAFATGTALPRAKIPIAGRNQGDRLIRIFVTGATGYIGGGVARALRRAGHEVFGLCRSAEKGRALARAEIHPVLGDMTQPATARK